MDCYNLEGKTPVKVEFHEWQGIMEKDRQVGLDRVEGVTVSTVFLGLDHRRWGQEGPPILFETMVFGGPYNENKERYPTWEEAEEGHRQMCIKVFST